MQASSSRRRLKPRSRSRTGAAGPAQRGTAQQESRLLQVLLHLQIRDQINCRSCFALHAARRVSSAVRSTSIVRVHPVTTQMPEGTLYMWHLAVPMLIAKRPFSFCNDHVANHWETPEFRARMDDLEKYDWGLDLSIAGLFIALRCSCYA